MRGVPQRYPRKLMSSEMYSGPSRALWELLQNADDCRYMEDAKMEIQKLGDDLWMLELASLGKLGIT